MYNFKDNVIYLLKYAEMIVMAMSLKACPFYNKKCKNCLYFGSFLSHIFLHSENYFLILLILIWYIGC